MTSSVQTPHRTFELTRVAGSLRDAGAFLMLGGGSLILLALFLIVRLPQVLMRDDVRSMLQEMTGGALFFVVLLSYPHFVWSYRFAYQQGFAFIKRHCVQLVLYPLLVIGLLSLCVYSWNFPVSNLPAVQSIDSTMASLGVTLNWSLYKGAGQLLFALLLIAQIIWSGHHYCMQAFGVALAGGEESGYSLSDKQKKILRINLYALWAMNLLSGFAFLAVLNNRTFAYHSFQLPAPISLGAYIVFGVTSLLVVFKVVLAKKQLPPFRVVVPILAVWIWLQPFVQPYGYQFLVVPIAHGAQYLYYSWKVELNDFDPAQTRLGHGAIRFAVLALLLLAAMAIGYASFHTLPVMLDQARLISGLSPNFFFLSAFILISTHHYVLDSVVWKQDSRAKKVLQGIN
ncbi:MAG TPA: hypothetical protein V6C89_03935 [Drouetiella sp.]|jgi:hypothetical protein